MSDAPFTVDGKVPSGFELGDTRHIVRPGGLTANRVERFPGYASGFAIKGSARPPQLIVPGTLRADGFKKLYQEIHQYNLDAASPSPVVVTFYDMAWPICSFMGLTLLGQPKVYSDDNWETKKAMCAVQLMFEVLENE